MRAMARALRILLAMLREIFDESAYARFLQRKQLASSRQAYSEFWRERETKYSRCQRCC
jgi:hypothetical protein